MTVPADAAPRLAAAPAPAHATAAAKPPPERPGVSLPRPRADERRPSSRRTARPARTASRSTRTAAPISRGWTSRRGWPITASGSAWDVDRSSLLRHYRRRIAAVPLEPRDFRCARIDRALAADGHRRCVRRQSVLVCWPFGPKRPVESRRAASSAVMAAVSCCGRGRGAGRGDRVHARLEGGDGGVHLLWRRYGLVKSAASTGRLVGVGVGDGDRLDLGEGQARGGAGGEGRRQEVELGLQGRRRGGEAGIRRVQRVERAAGDRVDRLRGLGRVLGRR